MSAKQTLSPLSVRDQVGERVRRGCLTGRLGAGRFGAGRFGAGRLETNDVVLPRSIRPTRFGFDSGQIALSLENHAISTGAVFERRS
jgi:hypothetical protein